MSRAFHASGMGYLLALFMLVSLVACGGGGGSSGGSSNASGFTLKTPAVTAKTLEGFPISTSISGDFFGLAEGTMVYIGLKGGDDLISSYNTSGETIYQTMYLVLALREDLAPGSYHDDLKLYVCLDSQCKRPLSGSPFSISFDAQVLSNIHLPAEIVLTRTGNDTPPSQALMVLGATDKTVHIRVDIDEHDIPRFKPGAPAGASLRGRPDVKYPMKYVRIDPYVIPKKSLTGDNTERVDTRVLQVLYALDVEDRPIFVGQQMDVFINTANGSEK